jgi:hypothetical protein
MTRHQGTPVSECSARTTARAAPGRFARSATPAYESVFPYGIAFTTASIAR